MRSLKRQRGFIGVGSAILGGAAIGGVGAYLGGQQQGEASRHASDIQQTLFQQTQQNLQPWMQSGNMALSQINQGLQPGGQFEHMFGLQDFQASPAYQFNLEQGKLALDKAAASRGKFYAPSTLQDIAKYSQGLASNEFQNAFSNYQTGIGNIWNRLQTVSGGGQNAAANLGTNATAMGQQLGANTIGAGNASAAQTVGITNALTGGLTNYANNQTLQQFLANSQRGSVGLDPVFQGPEPSDWRYGP
jgi:hypothetical protein